MENPQEDAHLKTRSHISIHLNATIVLIVWVNRHSKQPSVGTCVTTKDVYRRFIAQIPTLWHHKISITFEEIYSENYAQKMRRKKSLSNTESCIQSRSARSFNSSIGLNKQNEIENPKRLGIAHRKLKVKRAASSNPSHRHAQAKTENVNLICYS